MKLNKLLAALLFAVVINLNAQTDEHPTANEAAYTALEEVKKDDTVASPEATVIVDAILAAPTITKKELGIADKVIRKNKGEAAVIKNTRAIAASGKGGKGVLAAKAMVKKLDGDPSGWTAEMVANTQNKALTVIYRTKGNQKLQDLVWADLQRTSAAGFGRKFWKAYRATLPQAEQIAATKRQKEVLLAISDRDDAANAWLAAVSADLIALQLDAPATQ